jgi:hypothetical protein
MLFATQLRNTTYLVPGIVMQTYNFSTQEAEAGGSWVPGQPGLHSPILIQKTPKPSKQKLNVHLPGRLEQWCQALCQSWEILDLRKEKKETANFLIRKVNSQSVRE